MKFFLKLFVVVFLLVSPVFLSAQETNKTSSENESEGKKEITQKQYNRNIFNSFLRNGGMLRKGEHAVLLYVDADVLPPAVMLEYQYGILYWFAVGINAGGDYGVSQLLLRLKFENLKTFATETFFWGAHLKTGFKQHQVDLGGENGYFDDVSWILTLENTFAFRLGEPKKQRNVLYLNTIWYWDFDLRKEGRQVDFYIVPAELGYETFIGKYGSFFIELGMMYTHTGQETDRGILFAKSWFPVGSIGFGLRTGELTSEYKRDEVIVK